MKPNIFISYSRKDRAFVQRLADDLEQAGYDPWWDVADLRGGQAWAAEIEKHVRACDAMVVVLSPDSNHSEWVNKETLLADQLKKPIIPLKWRESELPLSLIDRQFVDFRGQYDKALQDLLRALPALPAAIPAPKPDIIPIPKNRQRTWGLMIGIALVVVGAIALMRWMEPSSGQITPIKKTAAPVIPSEEIAPPASISRAATATVAAQQTRAAETRQAIAREVVAQGTTRLVNKQSFDFLTGAKSQVGTLSGGDLYVLLGPAGGCNGAASFWANNLPQRGGVDLGPLSEHDLSRIQVPASESNYSHQCVPIVKNHVYAYLQNQEGLVVVFRVKQYQEGESIDLEYVVLADTDK